MSSSEESVLQREGAVALRAHPESEKERDRGCKGRGMPRPTSVIDTTSHSLISLRSSLIEMMDMSSSSAAAPLLNVRVRVLVLVSYRGLSGG